LVLANAATPGNALIRNIFLSGRIESTRYSLAKLAMSVRMRIAGYQYDARWSGGCTPNRA
jgi:hypothetical protein